MSLEEFKTQDARLVILRQLAEETDGRMNEASLTRVLDLFGHNRSRDWVRTQLRKLEELGAIVIKQPTENIMIAQLTTAGLDHVERRSFIEGVAKPRLAI